jgi:hypothetical protein
MQLQTSDKPLVIPFDESLTIIEATLPAGLLADQALEPSGRKWRVRIFEYGLSRNRYPIPGAAGKTAPLKWTAESARAALEHIDGARCFADHGADGSGRSVRDLVGFFSSPSLGQHGPEATLTLLESDCWVREKLLGAREAGRMDLIGFSVDAVITVRAVREGSQDVLEVSEVAAINSVDVVSAASSGGRALEVLEGSPTGSHQERAEGVAMIQEQQHDREQTAGASLHQELESASSSGITAVQEQIATLRQQITIAEARQAAAELRLRIDEKLTASRLPRPLASLVAEHLQVDGSHGGREITEEAIDMEIQRVREAYAALSPVGKIQETGRVKVMREPEEKLQMALDRMMGLPVEDKSIPAFHGIREAYITYTGDSDVTGMLPAQMRVREDITSTTFSNALGSTLRRLLLQDYNEQDYGVSLLAQFSSVPDFRTQERARIGYFGDLPTVSTESADYAELTAPTDEKASYSVVTFGGLVTVTRKMIINDDLGVVPKIVGRLGRSARRTLAQRVFNLMITNPAIYDSTAWFHATHGNLGSTALSATELDVVRTAMRNRTEKDSNKKLGIAPYVLVVPHELEGKARQENMREYLDSNNTPNPVRFMFGRDGERIIVSPLLTDVTDWYAFANISEAPTVEVGFLQGRTEPEFFLADDPNVDKVFTSDKIRYKVRHEFEAVVIDYRGAYKEVVVG